MHFEAMSFFFFLDASMISKYIMLTRYSIVKRKICVWGVPTLCLEREIVFVWDIEKSDAC